MSCYSPFKSLDVTVTALWKGSRAVWKNPWDLFKTSLLNWIKQKVRLAKYSPTERKTFCKFTIILKRAEENRLRFESTLSPN